MTTDIQTKMDCFEISIWDVIESYRELSADMRAEILESIAQDLINKRHS